VDKVKIPKFDWDRLDDCNAGHTEDEWGTKQSKLKRIRIIEAYTIRKIS
jgi:hypothetical protein